MKLNQIVKMNVLIATLLTGTVTAYAGGAQPDQPTTDKVLVSCTPDNASDTTVEELLYFVRVEDRAPNVIQSAGIYLQGAQFSSTVTAVNGLIHNIVTPQNEPQALEVARAEISAPNVRQLKIEVQGNRLQLSLVAGSLGHVIAKKLPMTCKIP